MTNSFSNTKLKMQKLAELGMDFFENQIEMAKLSIAETAVKSTNNIISSLVILIFSFLAFIFFSIGAAIWIGQYLTSMSKGFFIIGLFMILILIISLWIIKPIILKSISETIINNLDNENE